MKIFFPVLFLMLVLPLYSQSRAIEIFQIGRDLEGRGLIQEAESHYNEVVRICRDEISRNIATRDTYTAMTWALQRQGNFGEVISWGAQGLRLFANEYRIVQTMGEAYFYLNDFDNSLRFMQRYVNSVPTGDRVSVAYFFKGEIYRLERKFYLAEMAYSTAIRLQPAIALWWFRMGQVRESFGEGLLAAEAYGQALRLNPNYQLAADGLARVRSQ